VFLFRTNKPVNRSTFMTGVARGSPVNKRDKVKEGSPCRNKEAFSLRKAIMAAMRAFKIFSVDGESATNRHFPGLSDLFFPLEKEEKEE